MLFNKNYQLLFVISLSITIWAYLYLLIPQSPFFWDEAHHALNGLMIERSIKQCDINEFYTNTNRQIYWPFLHSWFLGVAFMVGGENYETARAINLFFYFISVLLMYFLGRKLNPNKRFLTGLTTVLLFITSPLILFYSTTCMVEPLGFFLMLLVLNIYWKGVESRKNIYFILAGFFMRWLYLSKYIFAFFVGGGFAIFTLTLLIERRGGIKDTNSHNLFKQTLLMLPGFFPYTYLGF